MNRSLPLAGVVPIDRISEEAWARLRRAADDPTDPFRLVTLASVTPEGQPAARLMMLRGADRVTGRLWCHSRHETQKILDYRACPSFALVAYDPIDAVQIRMTGGVKIHELDDTTISHYEQAAKARQSGQTPLDRLPDLLWPGSAELLAHVLRRDSWKHFAVLELKVMQMEWMQVAGDRSFRAVMRAEESWEARGVE